MLASLLSLSRFPIALMVFYLIAEKKFFAASFAIALGALTDFLDGLVARRRKQESRIGAQLDHIGDKFFVLTVLFALYLVERVELIPLLLLAFREVSVSFLRFYGLAQPTNFLGKLKTTFEFISLFVLCLEPQVGRFLLWVSVVLAYLSAVLYIRKPVKAGF